MNERIQKLAKEAGLWRQHYDIGEESPERLEKFAELIVREAGEAFWSEACHVSDLAYEEYSRNSKKIKQHFGVEE